MPSFKDLRTTLFELHDRMTLREIAEEIYLGKVSHATIHRCLDGHEPKDPDIRKVLDLPEIIVIKRERDAKGRFK
jgi:hypothetical protein